jgi:hypothetical protein
MKTATQPIGTLHRYGNGWLVPQSDDGRRAVFRQCGRHPVQLQGIFLPRSVRTSPHGPGGTTAD